jgi:hypothetical protein
MTVGELRAWLAQFPQDAKVFKSEPVQGDCENCRLATVGANSEELADIIYDERYPAVVIM